MSAKERGMRIVAVLATMLCAACAASNPVVTATEATPEHQPVTIAFALHNSYVVIAEQAVTIAEDPATPTNVKRLLVNLLTDASPVVAQLKRAAEEYSTVRAALVAGASTEEKVAAALSELNRLLLLAAPKVDALASTVSEKGGAP